MSQDRSIESALFTRLGSHSSKVRCTACGAIGYPGGRWQVTHLLGHAPCPTCGRMNSVTKKGRPRRCTNHDR